MRDRVSVWSFMFGVLWLGALVVYMSYNIGHDDGEEEAKGEGACDDAGGIWYAGTCYVECKRVEP